MSEIQIPINSEVMIHQLRNIQLLKEGDQLQAFTLTQTPGVISIPTSSNFTIIPAVAPSPYYPTATCIDIGSATTYPPGTTAGGTAGGAAITQDGHRAIISNDQYYVDAPDNITDSAISYDYTPGSLWNPIRGDDPAIPLTGFSTVSPYPGYPGDSPATNTLKRNSGNLSIPLTNGATNYVYLDYTMIMDPLALGITPDGTTVIDENVPPVYWFSKYIDGYRIYVKTAAGAPGNSIYLGSVTVNGGGVITSTSISTRQYFQSRGVTVNGILGANSDKTATYNEATAQTYTLNEHFQAKGTGTVSATNPHGLAPADLGIVPNSNQSNVPIYKAAAYPLAVTDGVLLVDAASSDITITLPPANVTNAGLRYRIRRIDTGAGGKTVTIAGYGTDVIDITMVNTITLAGSTTIYLTCGINSLSNYQWWYV